MKNSNILSCATKSGCSVMRRAYIMLSTYTFAFFAAQAMSISLLSNWLKTTLGLTGEETGIIFSANFIVALIFQPIYGYISDKIGLKRHILLFIALLVACCGPFFYFIYEPLLRTNIIVGAILGGAYLGATFIAGSFALESYIDRVGRKYDFEYSRVRLWGSLGFAFSAYFSGTLFNIDPNINFFIASAAALILFPALFFLNVKSTNNEVAETSSLQLSDALSLLKQVKFWRFMVLILGVTNLYLVYDQQFPVYYAMQFATADEGREMYGRLNSAQIFLEAGMLFVAPFIINKIGIKNGLLLATAIMIIRITASGLVEGAVAISLVKMLHSFELPILIVSIFRYIAAHFENRLASTLYLVGVSFGHSIGLAVLSKPVGKLYDVMGFPNTYLLIGTGAFFFWLCSIFALSPDPKQ
ncbi:MAG: oligosaccharide MFS transporter [Colwellia sp.]